MPKEYASFSSLIWSRVARTPHTWLWKSYLVWGIGCTDKDTRQGNCEGGVWFTNIDRCSYKNLLSAQAAVEHYDLQRHPPEFLMDDVDLVWDGLGAGEPTWDELKAATRLSDGRLSDAVARCYELAILQISIVTGVVRYLRATERLRG